MEKKSFLYRLRILFNEDGSPGLVETVQRTVIVDGNQRHPAGEQLETFDVSYVDSALVSAVLANLASAREEMHKDAEAKAAAAKAAEVEQE